MPVHWIEEDMLWFPPEGKSEAASQRVNKSKWRKYSIRHSYWGTRTFSRKEAMEKANELGKKEEREAEENGETTDTDIPQRGQRPVAKQVGFEATTSKPLPPSAPKVIARRKLYPKPPPSLHMQCPVTPVISDENEQEERQDPTWTNMQKRRKPCKPGNSVAACNTTLEQPEQPVPVAMTAQTSDLQPQSESTGTPIRLSQQLDTTTPTCVADLPDEPVTMTGRTSNPRQSESTVPPIYLSQQLETTTPTCVQQRSENVVMPRADLLQVLHQLGKIGRQLEDHIASVNRQFAVVDQRLTDIHQRTVTVETLLRDRPASSTEAAHAEVTGLPAAGQQLTEEQRRLLRRSPMVTNDEQWAELEATLINSGQYGPFFNALVQTVKDRIVDRSTVHKTANATLRTLVAEPYLAERVTMAGYKKCKIQQYNMIIIIIIIIRVSITSGNLEFDFPPGNTGNLEFRVISWNLVSPRRYFFLCPIVFITG